MKVISFDEIEKLNIEPAQCFRWVSDAITHKREAVLPPKISIKLDTRGGYSIIQCLPL